MTNMHTRNLALVWAPNLLRYSRESSHPEHHAEPQGERQHLNLETHPLRAMQRQRKVEQLKGTLEQSKQLPK